MEKQVCSRGETARPLATSALSGSAANNRGLKRNPVAPFLFRHLPALAGKGACSQGRLYCGIKTPADQRYSSLDPPNVKCPVYLTMIFGFKVKRTFVAASHLDYFKR